MAPRGDEPPGLRGAVEEREGAVVCVAATGNASVGFGWPIPPIQETEAMGDKSPKNTAKTNKQKAEHKTAVKTAPMAKK